MPSESEPLIRRPSRQDLLKLGFYSLLAVEVAGCQNTALRTNQPTPAQQPNTAYVHSGSEICFFPPKNETSAPDFKPPEFYIPFSPRTINEPQSIISIYDDIKDPSKGVVAMAVKSGVLKKAQGEPISTIINEQGIAISPIIVQNDSRTLSFGGVIHRLNGPLIDQNRCVAININPNSSFKLYLAWENFRIINLTLYEKLPGE